MRRLAFGLALFVAWAPFDARASTYVPAPTAAGQPESDILSSLASITCVADVLPYCSAPNTITETTVTAYARTVLDDANAAAARATLGVGAAVEVVPDLMAIGGESTLDAAEWVDAASIGGAYSVDLESLGGGTVLGMAANRDAAGDPITGVRTQGRMFPVPAGDFVIAVTLEFGTSRQATAALGADIEWGCAFIDGASAANDDWYGVIYYNLLSSVATPPAAYSESNIGGAGNQYTTSTAAAVLTGWGLAYMTSMRVVMQRSGVTLKLFLIREPGGSPILVDTWTVTAGAGYFGPRLELGLVNTEDPMWILVRKYRYQASATLPWVP